MTAGPLIDCELTVITESAAETLELGSELAHWLRDGDVLLLHGDLGAGKTTLAKGIAAALRVDAVVASPSFALVNEYEAGLAAPIARLYHLDLFRLTDRGELASIGFAELTSPLEGVTIVEWPERAVDDLPDRYLLVDIDSPTAGTRRFRFSLTPCDERWQARMVDLRNRLQRFLA
jgi:tRNA threonylcarbamoyladenosine biosynthesis protein TsaE